VDLPATGRLREADHPRDRGLADLGWAGEDGEAMAVEHGQRLCMRARGHEDARQLARRGEVEAPARDRLGVEQRLEVAQPQQRWQAAAKLWTGVDDRAELLEAEHAHRGRRGRHILDVGDHEQRARVRHELGRRAPLAPPGDPDHHRPRQHVV
jgi:hypothetical protein